jgi:hypothetical protein
MKETTNSAPKAEKRWMVETERGQAAESTSGVAADEPAVVIPQHNFVPRHHDWLNR